MANVMEVQLSKVNEYLKTYSRGTVLFVVLVVVFVTCSFVTFVFRAGYEIHPLWRGMSETVLDSVVTPEGPQGGGHPVGSLRRVLLAASNKMALEFLRMYIVLNSVVESGRLDTPCRSVFYNHGGPIRSDVDGSAAVSLLIGVKYPALTINGYVPCVGADGTMFGRPQSFWLACHRFMCWLCNGPSVGDKKIVHHRCENKRCINPEHLEWVPASENNCWPNETVGRRRSQNAEVQNRSPGTGRFKRRCQSSCECCTANMPGDRVVRRRNT
jgi:hypothetical protein